MIRQTCIRRNDIASISLYLHKFTSMFFFLHLFQYSVIFLIIKILRVGISHLWVWKISPKNPKFYYFFPIGSKNISLGWVKKIPGSKTGRPLIYCRVGLQGPFPVVSIFLSSLESLKQLIIYNFSFPFCHIKIKSSSTFVRSLYFQRHLV